MIKNRDGFINEVHHWFKNGQKLNKRQLEKIGKEYNISDISEVFEIAEYAWLQWYRKIALKGDSLDTTYNFLVDFYENIQPTFSLRDSTRVEFQQYSTPAPIAYLAQSFCKVNQANAIFEPSAGNGLLVFAAPYDRTVVNELDPQRLDNLRAQPFKEVLNRDAEDPEGFIEYQKSFDAILTNPPFGRLTERIKVDGFNIKCLDHAMVKVALDTLTDEGRAGIIIGGHSKFNEDGNIQSFRIFFNWLFHYYNVSDIININGDLYYKQGTSFDIRLILVNSRKKKNQGFSPILYEPNHPLKSVVDSFEDLKIRVQRSIEDPEWIFPKEAGIIIRGEQIPVVKKPSFKFKQRAERRARNESFPTHLASKDLLQGEIINLINQLKIANESIL